MATENSNLNTVLAKIGDFLGRKFNLVKSFVLEKFNEAKTYVDGKITELKEYVDGKAAEQKEYADTTAAEQKEYTNTKAKEAISESKTYTDEKITNLIDGAPENLDTLKEISEALKEHGDIITSLREVYDGHEASIGTYEQFVAAFNAQVGEDSIFYEK